MGGLMRPLSILQLFLRRYRYLISPIWRRPKFLRAFRSSFRLPISRNRFRVRLLRRNVRILRKLVRFLYGHLQRTLRRPRGHPVVLRRRRDIIMAILHFFLPGET